MYLTSPRTWKSKRYFSKGNFKVWRSGRTPLKLIFKWETTINLIVLFLYCSWLFCLFTYCSFEVHLSSKVFDYLFPSSSQIRRLIYWEKFQKKTNVPIQNWEKILRPNHPPTWSPYFSILNGGSTLRVRVYNYENIRILNIIRLNFNKHWCNLTYMFKTLNWQFLFFNFNCWVMIFLKR